MSYSEEVFNAIYNIIIHIYFNKRVMNTLFRKILRRTKNILLMYFIFIKQSEEETWLLKIYLVIKTLYNYSWYRNIIKAKENCSFYNEIKLINSNFPNV